MRFAPLLAGLVLTACLPRPPAFEPDSDSGSGSASGVLELEPGTTVDFGEIALGCSVRIELYAINSGQADLLITDVELVGADASLSWGTGDGAPFPWTLVPDERRMLGKLELASEIAIDESSLGTLLVQSSDPGGEVAVDVRGQVTGEQVTDGFTAGHWPMDIIFTVDRSGSTMDEIMALENELADFVANLSGAGIDFRILGVTEIDGCQSTGTAWIDSGYSGSAAAGLFSDMISVQPSSSVATQGLLRAQNALSDEGTGTGGCNEGFLRDDAMLHIIGLSDAADTSPGDCNLYVDAQTDRKKKPYEAVYHGIGAEVACGDALPYEGFLTAASTTEGNWVSFCDGDWWDDIPGLATNLINRADRITYPLSRQPLSATISVDVDGNTLEEGDWTFVEESNWVMLAPSVTPARGAPVKIRYFPQPDCE
jgi:hypothetical protein